MNRVQNNSLCFNTKLWEQPIERSKNFEQSFKRENTTSNFGLFNSGKSLRDFSEELGI